MKILLDENVHKKMRFRFPGHEVVTMGDMDWLGKRNGELMKLQRSFLIEQGKYRR